MNKWRKHKQRIRGNAWTWQEGGEKMSAMVPVWGRREGREGEYDKAAGE